MKRTPLTRKTSMTRGSFELTRTSGLEARTELRRTPPPPRTGSPGNGAQSGRGTGKARPARPVPEDVRQYVQRRDDLRCVRCGKFCVEGNRQLQHRVARGSGGREDHARPSALILLCGMSSTDPAGCHHVVESQPDYARDEGWRVPMNVDPECWPVRRHDGEKYVLTDDDGWAGLAV